MIRIMASLMIGPSRFETMMIHDIELIWYRCIFLLMRMFFPFYDGALELPAIQKFYLSGFIIDR